MNDAGAAASRVFAEVHALALHEGARTETFTGTAGVGDLVATVHRRGQPQPPRRRDARARHAPGRDPRGAGRDPEALDAVPLLAAGLERRGLPAEAVTELAALVDGPRASAPESVAAAR